MRKNAPPLKSWRKRTIQSRDRPPCPGTSHPLIPKPPLGRKEHQRRQIRRRGQTLLWNRPPPRLKTEPAFPRPLSPEAAAAASLRQILPSPAAPIFRLPLPGTAMRTGTGQKRKKTAKTERAAACPLWITCANCAAASATALPQLLWASVSACFSLNLFSTC